MSQTVVAEPEGRPIDPANQRRLAEVRARIHAAVGQVVLALSVVPRYRHQSFADLQTLVLDPLLRDRVAIATAAPVSGPAAGGQQTGQGSSRHAVADSAEAPSGRGDAPDAQWASEGAKGDHALAGIAFWASVSDAVDAKIREQIKGGAFPIRLKPEEWNCGDKVWLLDVIAPSQKMASAVLANFRKVVKSTGEVRIHPIVARQVDPELLRKMGAVAEGGAQQS